MTAAVTSSHLNSRGFTLVEMLMSMLVLTVGLLGLLQSVSVAYKHSLKDRLRKEATLLAEERMHDLSSRRFDIISCVGDREEQGEKSVAGVPWRFTLTKRADLVGSTTSTKKLRVKVEWTVKTESHSHEIFTLKTKRGDE